MQARLVAIAGAALVVLGFFLPWIHGTAEFSPRDFSGFDLARLVRNFEIARADQAAEFRGITLTLYALPALAINGAILAQFTQIRHAAGAALCIAAAYGLGVLLTTFFLSAVSWTDLERVLGGPMSGYFVSLLGVAALAESGLALLLRRHPTGYEEALPEEELTFRRE